MESAELERAKQKVLATVDGMRDEIVDTLCSVVRIPSVNPKYPGQNYNEVVGEETRANEYLARHYRDLGAEIELYAAEAKRANLIGVWKGTGGGKSLIFNGHVDVVPVSDPERWEFGDPFSGKIKDGRMYGRGTTDMKSGLVANVKAAQAIQRAGVKLRGDLILESVVGEEVMDHLAGTTAVARKYKADAAIVSEPTAPPVSLAVVPVTPGLWWMSVTVKGKAVHSSVRDELIRAGGRGAEIGVNAIEKGVYILQALRQLEDQWGQTKTHSLFKAGHFTIHPGVIQGGPYGVMVPFIISEFCTIEYAVWYPPQEDAAAIQREIEGYIHDAAQLDPWLKENPPAVQWKLNWPASSIEKEHPISKAIASAHWQASAGRPASAAQPSFQGFAAVCDATFLNVEGIPAVIYGPGNILVAHALNEYVEIEELIQATKSFAIVAMDWCGVAG